MAGLASGGSTKRGPLSTASEFLRRYLPGRWWAGPDSGQKETSQDPCTADVSEHSAAVPQHGLRPRVVSINFENTVG
jgi:hypothetical protein